MVTIFPKPGENVPFEQLHPALRAPFLIACSGELIAGYCQDRGTIEVYKVVVSGSHGVAEFLGFLSGAPLILKGA